MTFFTFGTSVICGLIIAYSYIKGRSPEFMNWLSNIQFPILVNSQTGQVEFAKGIWQNVSQCFYFSKYETLNMCLFAIVGTSLVSAAVNGAKAENHFKFLSTTSLIIFIALAMVFQVIILSNFSHKHGLYYLKYGAVFGIVYTAIVLILDTASRYSEPIYVTEINRNWYLISNLNYHFQMSFNKRDLLSNLQLVTYGIGLFFVIMSFASIATSLSAHRLMNIKIQTVTSKNSNALEIIEAYKTNQKVLIAVTLVNFAFIIVSKKVISMSNWLFIGYILLNLIAKVFLLPNELQLTFSKATQSAIELKMQLQERNRQQHKTPTTKEEREKEERFRESFKKVNNDCTKTLKESVRITLIVIVPFLLLTLLGSMILYLHSNENYPGFNPIVNPRNYHYQKFTDLLKMERMKSKMSLAPKFEKSLIMKEETTVKVNSEDITNFYKSLLFAFKELIVLGCKLSALFLTGFESATNLLMLLFIKRINF